MGIEIANINIRIAENQRMPKLDVVTTLRTQSLDNSAGDAFEQMYNGDYVSYGVGLSLEYPIGNRKRETELLERRIARRKAVVNLENIADQAAQLTKQSVRRIETDYNEIEKQKAASEAALIHLQVLDQSESIRESLTPEFLFLKLQAQDYLANALIAEISAITDYNIAIAELSRLLGATLNLHLIEPIITKREENNTSDISNDELVPVEIN